MNEVNRPSEQPDNNKKHALHPFKKKKPSQKDDESLKLDSDPLSRGISSDDSPRPSEGESSDESDWLE